MDLLFIDDSIGRCSLTDYLLKMDAGDHVKASPPCVYKKVRGVRITPDPASLRSEFMVDGEVIE